MLDAELDFQLLVYFIFSPIGILSAYSLDEFDMFSWNTRMTDLISSRSPTPIEPESLPVPSNDRIRLYDDERRFPTIPYFRQEHPEDSVSRCQSRWPYFFSQIDSKLLTMGEILDDKSLLTFENCCNDSRDHAYERYHLGILAYSENPNDFNTDGVFAEHDATCS